MRLITPNFYTISDPFVNLNYGVLELSFDPDTDLVLDA
jgi:hypothetical protein